MVNVAGWTTSDWEVGRFAAHTGVAVLALVEHWLVDESPVVPGFRWVEDRGSRPGRQPGARRGSGGVAVLVAERMAEGAVLRRELCTQRQVWVTVRWRGALVHVGCVYAPMVKLGNMPYAEFVADLGVAVSVLRREGGGLVILGDFNVDILATTARAGMLVMAMQKAAVRVPAEAVAKRIPTFQRGQQASIIDYIMLDLPSADYTVWEDRDLCCDGHRAITVDVRLGVTEAVPAANVQWVWKPTSARATDWTAYRRLAHSYLSNLDDWVQTFPLEAWSQTRRQATIDVVALHFTTAMSTAADFGLGISRRGVNTKPWWSDNLEVLSEVRKAKWRAVQAAGPTPSEDLIREFKLARKEFVRGLRRRKRQMWGEAWATVAQDKGEGLSRLWWRECKKLRGKVVVPLGEVYVVGGSGPTTASIEERKRVWNGYYSKVGEGVSGDWLPPFADLPPPPVDEWGQPPTMEETCSAISTTGKWKAGGSDGVLPFLLVEGGMVVAHGLWTLMKLVYEWEVVPSQWKDAIVNLLFKDGDPLCVDNWRPISLISSVGKVGERVSQARLSGRVEGSGVLSNQQLGFRPGMGSLESLLWVTEVLKNRRAAKLETFVVFLDVRKAYDTVWHDGLWSRLTELGLSGKCARVIRGLYSGGTARVRVGQDALTEPHYLHAGVKQGGVASSTLYTIFIDSIVDDLQVAGVGVWERLTWCGNSLYADDMAVIAASTRELQSAMEIVEAHSRKWRYRFNAGKCKVMVVGQHMPHPVRVTLCGEVLEVVKSYKYLGVWISHDLRWNTHVDKMAEKAVKRTAELRRFANKSGGMSAEVAVTLWRSEIRPLWEYALGIWGMDLPAYQLEKLEVAQRKVLRGIMWLGSTTTNEAVLMESGCERMVDRRNKLALNLWCKYCKQQMGGQQLQQILQHRWALPQLPGWSWGCKVMAMAGSYGVSDMLTLLNNDKSVLLWKQHVAGLIMQRKVQQLSTGAKVRPKLRTYLQVAPAHGEAGPYLPFTYLLGARLITRLRTGTNGLEVEMDRARGKGVEERVCPGCGRATEDEVHFLTCPCYHVHRAHWWADMQMVLDSPTTCDGKVLLGMLSDEKQWALEVLRGGQSLQIQKNRERFLRSSIHMVTEMWKMRREMVRGVS